jgi:hypothetical protein
MKFADNQFRGTAALGAFSRLFPGLLAVVFLSNALFAQEDASAESKPRVVGMVPENGSRKVDPKLDKILITFSEPMTDQSWSICGGGEHFPEIKGIRYTKKCTVLEITVRLKPGWSYEFLLNSPSYRNFLSREGVPLDPVGVRFETRGKKPTGKSGKKPVLEKLGKIDFDLADAAGIRIRSQDYAGVPLFIVFGAAW